MAISSPEAYRKAIASPSTMDSSYAMQATTELLFLMPGALLFLMPGALLFLMPGALLFFDAGALLFVPPAHSLAGWLRAP